MEDRTTLSKKESKRIEILEGLKLGKMGQGEAAGRMQISVRQVQRLIKKYCLQGIEGLAHKLRGKPSKKALSSDFKSYVIQIIQMIS